MLKKEPDRPGSITDVVIRSHNWNSTPFHCFAVFVFAEIHEKLLFKQPITPRQVTELKMSCLYQLQM
jgi:hypothetical protein